MNAARFHQLLRDHSLEMARIGNAITRALHVKWARADHHRYLAAKKAVRS